MNLTPSKQSPVELGLAKTKTVSVLLVEDDADFARLVREWLRRAPATEFDVHHVERAQDARQYLLESSADCVLLDLSLPDAHYLEASSALLAVAPDAPLVILTGLEDELLAAKALHQGAQDYLMKGEIGRESLARAINYAIERKRGEIERVDDTMHDPLTRLPNRTFFLDRLTQAVDRGRRHNFPLVVLIVQLDDFSLIKESLGQQVHDQLLVAVAGRLRTVLRETDTVARFPGASFAMLCENVSTGRHPAEIAGRLMSSIEAPFMLEADRAFASARIGMVKTTTGDQDADDLVRQAEMALQRATERGKSYELLYSAGPSNGHKDH